MKGMGDGKDEGKKPSGDEHHSGDHPQQTTNAVAYAFVHPAHPLTRIYYFPAMATFIIAELGLAFVPDPNDQRYTTSSLSSDYGGSGGGGGDGFSSGIPGYRGGYYAQSNSFYDFITFFPAFLFTSFFLFMLVSNMLYGGVPDLENRYVSRSDDAAVITNRVGGGMLAGLSWALSYAKNAFGGLGGIGTGVVSEGVAVAVGGFETLTNERILDNHSRDRSSRGTNNEITGYMRGLDYVGDRGERLITRAMEAASWLFYRYADSGLAARIHINDGNRAAFRAGIANGERFAIDLLVGYMNAMVLYLERTADLYLISRVLQTLRIADSSGSTIGTWRAFDPNAKSAVEKVGDGLERAGENFAHGAQHVAHDAVAIMHNIGDGLSGLFHPNRAQHVEPLAAARADAATQTDPVGFPGIFPWLYAFIFGTPNLRQQAQADIHPPGYNHTVGLFNNLFEHHKMIIRPVDGNQNLFTLPGGAQVQITQDAITIPGSGLTINLSDNSIDLPGGLHLGPMSASAVPGLISITPGNPFVIRTELQTITLSRVTDETEARGHTFSGFFANHHDQGLGHLSYANRERIEVSSIQRIAGEQIVIIFGGFKITISAADNRKPSAEDCSSVGDDHTKGGDHHDHDYDHSHDGGGGLNTLGNTGDHHDA